MSNSTLSLDPGQVRPLLHAEIDRLGDEEVLLLHRIALELEFEAVSRRLDEKFDESRATGRLDNLDQVIRDARAAIRARKAS